MRIVALALLAGGIGGLEISRRFLARFWAYDETGSASSS
jgi:uncharacterized protein YneF (UPF0154 family)